VRLKLLSVIAKNRSHPYFFLFLEYFCVVSDSPFLPTHGMKLGLSHLAAFSPRLDQLQYQQVFYFLYCIYHVGVAHKEIFILDLILGEKLTEVAERGMVS